MEHTVGKATPYAIFAISGPAELNAGDVTPFPAYK